MNYKCKLGNVASHTVAQSYWWRTFNVLQNDKSQKTIVWFQQQSRYSWLIYTIIQRDLDIHLLFCFCSRSTIIKEAAGRNVFIEGSKYSEFVSAATLCALGDGPLQQVHRSRSSVQSGHCALSFHRWLTSLHSSMLEVEHSEMLAAFKMHDFQPSANKSL